MDRLIYLGTRTPPELRLQVLSDVVNKLKEDFGSWAVPWGEINRFQRLTGEIEQTYDDNQPSIAIGMASGNWGRWLRMVHGAQPTQKNFTARMATVLLPW